MKRKLSKKFLIIVVIIALLVASFFIYFSIYYHASTDSWTNLTSTKEVKVSKIDKGYFFDGVYSSTLIIFYPGAKVDCLAYSMLMKDLATYGYDVILLDVPFRFAFFGINDVQDIINEYSNYSNYYIMGHSLGGVVASLSADNEKVEGIILLASYSTKTINKPVLSIYGSNDEVLNREKYENSKNKYLDVFEEYVIDGGNHSGFGSYGSQKGDGERKISNLSQINQTISYITQFISNN